MREGKEVGVEANINNQSKIIIVYITVKIISICNISVKQKITVINEMKRDKILLKPKVLD
jgi:hypothetical protein